MKGNFEPNKKEIKEVGRWNSDIVLKINKKNQFFWVYTYNFASFAQRH